MDYLPKDPAILVSSVNMLLRDEEYDTLEALCLQQRSKADKGLPLQKRVCLEWATETIQAHRLRPMITKDSIETTYSFLHQKRNVYIHSTLDWQKDDIEYAIGTYVDDMSPELYEAISDERNDFLRDHKRFREDITQAVERLEEML